MRLSISIRELESKADVPSNCQYSQFPFLAKPKGPGNLFSEKKNFFKSNANQQRNNYGGTENSLLYLQNFVITEFVRSGIHCMGLFIWILSGSRNTKKRARAASFSFSSTIRGAGVSMRRRKIIV